jgi:hypothetical protein
VALLDDDDRLLPGALSARLEALDRHPQACLVHGPALATDADGRPRPRSRGRAGPRRERCEDGIDAQRAGRSVVPSTCLLRREAVERAGRFDEDLATGEDWLFFLRAAAAGPFVWLPEPTVLYRRHAGQARGDPAAQEAALPVWTSRFFDDPGVPERARRGRRGVVGRHLLWIARNHRLAGDAASARRCARAAARADPSLLLRPRRLAQILSLAWARPAEGGA